MRTNHGRLKAVLAGAGVLAVTLLAAPAAAQDALGAGDALDANTNAQEGRRNRAARQIDFSSRNRVVTGNVAGGREFRGEVGYLAPRDFQGLLGSNDLFRFRASSAFSSPVLAPISGIDALRFGIETGAIGYARSGSAASPQTVGASRWYLPTGDVERRILVDRMTLSRSLAVRGEQDAEAELVGTTTGLEGQPLLVTASPVRGIMTSPQEGDLSLLGLSSFDRARLLEDQEQETTETAAAPGERFDPRVSTMLDQKARISTALDDTRVDPRAPTDYERILQRIADRYVDREDVDLQLQRDLLDNLDEDLEALREQLQEGPATDADAAEEEEDAPEAGSEEAPPRDVVPPSSRVEDLGIILQHGARIEQLTTEGRTRFDQLVASGEERLRAGEYFWAERRFERALRFVPGHPLATAGLGHAQIGAGVYLPAAMTLRSLLLMQPEMIDVQFAEGLLPNRVQLNQAVNELEARLASGVDGRDAGLYGFLLAYIGHQIGERPLVDRGLELMSRSEENETIVGLLDRVWRAESAPEK